MSRTNRKVFSVSLYPAQRDVIEAAAKKSGKTVADYFRDEIVPLTAEHAGLPVPRTVRKTLPPPDLTPPPQDVSKLVVAPGMQDALAKLIYRSSSLDSFLEALAKVESANQN